MTQKVKVVQKMPPEKRNKKVTKLWGKNSTRKGVLRQRQKSKENFKTKFYMCTRILPCYMSFVYLSIDKKYQKYKSVELGDQLTCWGRGCHTWGRCWGC